MEATCSLRWNPMRATRRACRRGTSTDGASSQSSSSSPPEQQVVELFFKSNNMSMKKKTIAINWINMCYMRFEILKIFLNQWDECFM